MFAPRRNRKPSSIRRQLHAHTIGIGHNGGPPLSDVWLEYTWRKASKKAWKTPDKLILDRRLARAEALGMTYREYVLEILERGRNL